MRMLSFFAETAKVNPSDVGINDPVTNANGLVGGVLNTVYFWAGVVAVIVIIVAGYLYVTANANSQRITRAKDAIISAVVGLVVIVMAFVITQYVLGRF